MGRYVESALTKGEKVIYEGKTSIWSLLPLILLGLLTLGIFGLGLLFGSQQQYVISPQSWP